MRELSLHVLDIAQNSIAAGASFVRIEITEEMQPHRMRIRVEDDGKGMSGEQVERVCSPFYTTRTTRKVGLGIPLFKMAAEMTGGSFTIESQPGQGTVVTALFHADHVDMIPLGDIDSTVFTLIRCNPGLDFLFEHRIGDRCLVLDTRVLRETLGGEVPLDTPEVMDWITEYVKEQRMIIFGGAR